MSNQNLSEEEYLKKHLTEVDNRSSFEAVAEPTPSANRTTDLQYLSFDVKELPCGDFYPQGTFLLVRAAQVKEIQAYSMVDDNNFYDVVEKMNDMLQSCVRVKYPDGKVASFLDIKDQDRLYLVFLIRELTFQKGNSLSVNAKCSCGAANEIELKRSNFKFHIIDEKLSKFFNKSTNSYTFNVVNGKRFSLTPPTIGLQKDFTNYIIQETNEKKNPNMAFLKIIPFMLEGRSSITIDGIKAKLQEFETMDDISFQFLNSAVGKMTYGIKELVAKCNSCGVDVVAEMAFPYGASGIFIVHDAFEAFIKE